MPPLFHVSLSVDGATDTDDGTMRAARRRKGAPRPCPPPEWQGRGALGSFLRRGRHDPPRNILLPRVVVPEPDRRLA